MQRRSFFKAILGGLVAALLPKLVADWLGMSDVGANDPRPYVIDLSDYKRSKIKVPAFGGSGIFTIECPPTKCLRVWTGGGNRGRAEYLDDDGMWHDAVISH